MNSEAGAAHCVAAAKAVVGSAGLRTDDEIMTMGGEDFSYYLLQRTGCFVFVGCRRRGTPMLPQHHNR